MAFDYQWHFRFNACVATVASKGVIALVLNNEVFVESVEHTYKLTKEETNEFLEALNSLEKTCGHTRTECILYLAYDFIGAVIQEQQ